MGDIQKRLPPGLIWAVYFNFFVRLPSKRQKAMQSGAEAPPGHGQPLSMWGKGYKQNAARFCSSGWCQFDKEGTHSRAFDRRQEKICAMNEIFLDFLPEEIGELPEAF